MPKAVFSDTLRQPNLREGPKALVALVVVTTPRAATIGAAAEAAEAAG